MDSTISFMEDAHSKKSTLVDAVASLFKSKRLLIIQVISMFTFFASALAAWKMLSYTLDTATPVVVILTYSVLCFLPVLVDPCFPSIDVVTFS